MKNTKAIVVEDEAIVSKDIQVCLKKLGYQVIGSFSSGEKLLESLPDLNPDVILLDIMLSGQMSGVETSAIIKEKYNIPVIFLTAYTDEKTLSKAKVTEPYGYIVKPFKEIDLRTSIEMALYKWKKENEVFENRSRIRENITTDFVYIKHNSRLIKLNNEDIYFIEALKDYVSIYTEDMKYTIHSTMKEMENKLNSNDFFRIHRSFIVNLKKIKEIESQNVVLDKDERVLPIGGSYKEELFQRINLV